MAISSKDFVPLSQALNELSELAAQVKAGAEKIITKDGERYVALIDAERLDFYHRLEHEHLHVALVEDALRGVEDVEAGRVKDARIAIEDLKRSLK